MSLPLHGDTVQVTGVGFILRGYYTEYTAFYQFTPPDTSNPIQRNLKFNETVAKAFRSAGYTDVKYSISSVIVNLPMVDVVLGTRQIKRGEVLCITHILASDGTVHEVTPERRTGSDKTSDYTPEQIAEIEARYGDPATKARLAEQKKQAEHAARFAHGEKMIRAELAKIHAQKEVSQIFKLHNAAWLRGIAA
jgi:hypothetical protein